MIMGYAASHAAPTVKTKSEGDTAQMLRGAIGAKGQDDRARKYAEQLATGKGDGPANLLKRNWRGDDLALADLMDPLRPVKKGGDGLASELQITLPLKTGLNGIEEKVRKLAAKKLSEPNMERTSKELALLSYRMAVLGEIVHE